MYENADFVISLDDSSEEYGAPVDAVIKDILFKIDEKIEETRKQRQELQSKTKLKEDIDIN